MVVSYYLQQQQEDDIEEEERNETLHQTKLSSIIIFSFGYIMIMARHLWFNFCNLLQRYICHLLLPGSQRWQTQRRIMQ